MSHPAYKNNHPQVFCIGGATLDTIIEYEEMETLIHQKQGAEQSYLLLEEGKKIEVTHQQSFSGGGATNAAVSLKRLGLDAKLFCKIGEDPAGNMVFQELKNMGLDTDHICVTKMAGTATSFVVPSLKGDRTLFAYRGANSTLLAEDIPEDLIKAADFLYITSLSRASAAHLPDIVKLAQLHGTKVAINPGSSQLKRGSGFLKDALFGIEILILNYEEAQLLMASLLNQAPEITSQSEHEQLLEQSKTAFSLREFFRLVLSQGPKIVVVTNGSKGVYVCQGEQLFFHQAVKVDVVNTLGAGDAFGSSFVGAYLLGKSIPDAMRFGVLNSASVVSYSDAKSGLLSREILESKVEKLDRSLLENL